MFNKRIFNMIGYVLLFLGISMFFSAIWSYLDNSDDLDDDCDTNDRDECGVCGGSGLITFYYDYDI